MPVYHLNWYSNCTTLEVGCFLGYYAGGGVWVNADDDVNVVNGKFSDGTYCYTVVDGIITSKDTCAPAFATLTVYYQSGRYYAYLDVALTANVTVSAFSTGVSGYTDAGCSTSSFESDTSQNNLVISAGLTSIDEPGNLVMGCSTYYYNFDGQLHVNGTYVTDGGTVSIGGTTVTVLYASGCFSYFC